MCLWLYIGVCVGVVFCDFSFHGERGLSQGKNYNMLK